MPKLEPSLPWPPSTASSVLAGAVKRTVEPPPKPAIQGLEVNELDSQTEFDRLFGANPDAKPPRAAQR